MTKAMAKVMAGRARLVLDHPFFATLALHLGIEESPSCGTACVNGVRMRFAPDFVNSLLATELVTVWCHEVMHCALGHASRRFDRDHELWNIAGDYAINIILVDAGLQMPAGAYVDDAFRGMTTDEIYRILDERRQEDEQQQQESPGADGAQDDSGGGSDDGKSEKGGKSEKCCDDKPQGQDVGGEDAEDDESTDEDGSGGGDGDNGDGDNGDGDGQKDNGETAETKDPGRMGAVEDAPVGVNKSELDDTWRIVLAQAAVLAAGNMPGSLKKVVDSIIAPRPPFLAMLEDFVDRTARNDYDTSRPSRRYLPCGLIMPTLRSDELPAIVIAIDSSGSVWRHVDKFAAAVSAVLERFETTIHVIYVDAEVRDYKEVTRHDLPLVLEPSGGGGTRFGPAFEWVEKQGLTPACLVYLTDLCGSMPEREPDYPVLWVTTEEKSRAPFGETVYMPLTD